MYIVPNKDKPKKISVGSFFIRFCLIICSFAGLVGFPYHLLMSKDADFYGFTKAFMYGMSFAFGVVFFGICLYVTRNDKPIKPEKTIIR